MAHVFSTDDSSRVKLSVLGSPFDDYINASYMPVGKTTKNISFVHNCHTNCAIFPGLRIKEGVYRSPRATALHCQWLLETDLGEKRADYCHAHQMQRAGTGRVYIHTLLCFIPPCFNQFYHQISMHVRTGIIFLTLNRLITTYSKFISLFRFSSQVLNVAIMLTVPLR